MPAKLQKQRARSADDKELRRLAIVGAARRALQRRPLAELTVAEMGRAAGLAKGSVFRYFPTREELVLAVYEEELAELFAALGAQIVAEPSLTADRLASLFVAEVAARPVFLQLSVVVHAVLEHRVSLDSAVRFKRVLATHLFGAGLLLESRLAGLRPGEGAKLILRAHALLIGFWQLCDHPPVVAEAVRTTGLDVFKLDFARELEEVLVTLLRGMEART
jgi:TetR/AcrR family transcriptional regulator